MDALCWCPHTFIPWGEKRSARFIHTSAWGLWRRYNLYLAQFWGKLFGCTLIGKIKSVWGEPIKCLRRCLVMYGAPLLRSSSWLKELSYDLVVRDSNTIQFLYKYGARTQASPSFQAFFFHRQSLGQSWDWICRARYWRWRGVSRTNGPTEPCAPNPEASKFHGRTRGKCYSVIIINKTLLRRPKFFEVAYCQSNFKITP